jgi:hypothetical protein
MEILDSAGKVIRTFTNTAEPAGRGGRGGAAAADAPDAAAADEAAPGGDEEGGGGGGRGGRGASIRVDPATGMHRVTWDLRYPGPWQSAARPEGPNGPVAVPGKYSVRLTAGAWTATQPLTIAEDPRIAASGVTLADLRGQFDHNVKVRDLVSEINQLVARVREAEQSLRRDPAQAAKLDQIQTLESHLITPSIRYSKPELQTHITYLYQMTNSADEKIGNDAIQRYQELKKELEQRKVELEKIIGPGK